MNPKGKTTIFLPLFLLVWVCLPVFASDSSPKSPLKDPHIPNGEYSVYRVVNKRGTFQIEDFVKISDNKKYYIVKSVTKETTKILRLSRETMFPVRLEILTNKKEYNIHSVKQIRYKAETEKNIIPVIGSFDSRYTLRGFPFETPTPLIMDFISESEGPRSSSFEVSLNLIGKENVNIGRKTIPSYILEIKYKLKGFLALFKSMLPKTKIWYSVEKPHYMVKYENRGGQGENSETTITLIRYSGWK